MLWGRDLLHIGLWWRIGDGDSVDVYGSNWLPRDFSFQVQSGPSLPLDSKLSCLFTETGDWDVSKLQMHFTFDEARLISSLPRGLAVMEDHQIWHFEKSGLFTVKSGY